MHPFMTKHRHSLTLTGLALVASLVMGCQLLGTARPTPSGVPSVDEASKEPGSEPGRSPANLTGGLKNLASYRVTYSQTTQGQLDGKPYETRQLITRTLMTQPASEDSTLDSLQADGTAAYLHYIRLGSAQYFQHSKQAGCQGAVYSQPNGAIGDPAALLPSLNLPKSDGSEVINGVQAAHYRFDGKAIHLVSGTAAGEVWIAVQGSYVVKYTLEIQPPAVLTGKGLEAHRLIAYSLTDANQVPQIDLPAGCIPVLTSIPALPDATDIDRRSAFMSYTTSSDKAGVTAFYNREMPALGWAADEAPVTGAPENAGPGTGAQGLSYTKDKSTVNILFELSAGGLTVYVQLFDQAVMPLLPTAAPASPAGPAGTGTPAPAAEPTVTIQPPEPASATPTADASASGLPPEAPLYPGASQVQTLSGMGVSFQTADSLDKVVAFYYNHLNNTRWKLMRNDNSGTVAVMTWQAGSATIIITVQAQTNHTQVSIVMTGK